MIPILGGLGAALSWAGSALVSAQSSRTIGVARTLAWVMLIGFVVVFPFAIADRGALSARHLPWLLVSGGGNVVGLALNYAALRRGRVGVVAPLGSTEGAIAALISAAFGEPIQAGVGVALVVVAAGAALTAAAADRDAAPVPIPAPRQAVALGALTAVAFGASLYATGHVASELPMMWAILPARLIGVGLLAGPMLARGRMHIPGRAAPLVVAIGLLEVSGFAAYTIGANVSIAVTAVIASEFAAIAAIGAAVFLGERLSRVQQAGVATIAVGVALLAVAKG